MALGTSVYSGSNAEISRDCNELAALRIGMKSELLNLEYI